MWKWPSRRVIFYHKKSAGPVSFVDAKAPDQPTKQATIMSGARQLQMGQHRRENGYKPVQIPIKFRHLRQYDAAHAVQL